MEVHYVGEDWERLRELVEASTLPGRTEVLAVIDNTDIFKGREKKLMDLQGRSALQPYAGGAFSIAPAG